MIHPPPAVVRTAGGPYTAAMASRPALVGRRAERERLEGALGEARLGRGALLLVSGEAGVGKTRLADELAAAAGAPVLAGRAAHGGAEPYGPVVAALRSHLRGHPGALDGCGPLRPHLALLLPELGDAASASDRATLVEALCAALAHLARDGLVLVLLDDLQWSDDATLELLAALAQPLGRMSLLVVAGYRSDGLARDHMLRHLRHGLRRDGLLEELTLAPLAPAETTELLGEVLGDVPGPPLARAIHDRTQGLPFFVEEMARALRAADAVTAGPRGLELAGGGEVPVPETIRDAVLMSASELSSPARAAAEAAAVAGEAFDLGVVERIAGAEGLTELIGRGVVREDGAGRAAFRHALTREALYADVPWLQRRALHRRLAEALVADGGGAMEVATQWLGAREERLAREALLVAARESRTVHAHRDAARAGRQALELWPEGEDGPGRVAVLEDYAVSAELAGELAEAARAWREICTVQGGLGEPECVATGRRRLAAVLGLLGDREAATAARREAARAYADAGLPAEAAVERLVIADQLRASSNHTDAIALARAAGRDAAAADRLDLRARALGLEGVSLATRGEFDEGLAAVQEGLALALEHNLTPVAAELYQRLSTVLYDAADYRRAEETLTTALDLCRTGDLASTELLCVTCMVYVLRECGEWPRALEIGRDLIDAGRAVGMTEGLVAPIHAEQGRLRTARRMLTGSLAGSLQRDDFNMIADTTSALAWVAAAEGADDEAADLCHDLLARWEASEDHHLAVRGLRFAAGFFARRGDLEGAHACAAALTRIASATGHADALAALAAAIGEIALADGDALTAAQQLSRAVELHRGLDIPYERAEIELRAGVALVAAGQRERGLERMGDAYRTARKLGAKPLATEAARAVADMGESVTRRLGRRAAADAEGALLSRREREVVRLVAVGHTNREIAQELYLSPRTVDMHVRNLFRKLDCRSRVEAVRRAGDLGLLA